MQIENGRFYFISNEFIKKYGVKYNLMENKETGTKKAENVLRFEARGIHVAFSNLINFRKELLDNL